MGAHTTSDDPTRYRTKADEEVWRRRDPIDRLATLLRAEGSSEDFFAGVQAEADELGEQARAYCRAIAVPPSSRMFENVYATANGQVSAEREWFTEYTEGFVTEEVAR